MGVCHGPQGSIYFTNNKELASYDIEPASVTGDPIEKV